MDKTRNSSTQSIQLQCDFKPTTGFHEFSSSLRLGTRWLVFKTASWLSCLILPEGWPRKLWDMELWIVVCRCKSSPTYPNEDGKTDWAQRFRPGKRVLLLSVPYSGIFSSVKVPIPFLGEIHIAKPNFLVDNNRHLKVRLNITYELAGIVHFASECDASDDIESIWQWHRLKCVIK